MFYQTDPVGAIDDQVGQYRPRFPVESAPWVAAANRLVLRDAGNCRQRAVPVRDDMPVVKNERGYRRGVDDLCQAWLAGGLGRVGTNGFRVLAMIHRRLPGAGPSGKRRLWFLS